METDQSKILRWWRDLPKENKTQIMTELNIKAISYEQIKTIYNEQRN